MKNLWLHIGLGKTGTSALQVFFARNQEKLLESGIDYPQLISLEDAKQGTITSGNGVLLARFLLPDDHDLKYNDNSLHYNNFIEWVKSSATENGLLSSEFFQIPLPKLAQLKNELDQIGVKLKLICYFRRQDQQLMSGYIQAVKREGVTETGEEWVQNIFKKRDRLKFYDFIKDNKNILGVDNVFSYIFDPTKKHKKGLPGHFIESILGHCPDWVKESPVINTSPSPVEIKFMLIANKFSPRMQFSDCLVENSIKLGKSTDYQTHNIFSPKITQEILSYFSQQNKLFEKEYANGDTFPDSGKSSYVNLQDLEFSPLDVMQIVTGFLVKYDKDIASLADSLSAYNNRLELLESRLNTVCDQVSNKSKALRKILKWIINKSYILNKLRQ